MERNEPSVDIILPNYNSEKFIAHLTKDVNPHLFHLASADQDYCIIIGPEGGFTPEEQNLAQQHDWTAVSLGSRTLRIETAAIIWAAACAVTDKDC